MKKQSDIITIIIFMTILLIAMIGHIITPDKELDKDERRYLANAPKIKFEPLANGEFWDEFEEYLLDQFPNRTQFREIKSLCNYYAFLKQENANIIIYDNQLIKLDLNYDYDKILSSTTKLNKLKNSLFKSNKAYFVLIPDKNCYLEENNVSYTKIFDAILIAGTRKINIFNQLELLNYYKSDTHWNQICLQNVVNYILKEIGQQPQIIDYEVQDIQKFKGVLASQNASLKEDELQILINDELRQATVYNFETNKTIPIYTLDNLQNEKNIDTYDVFLNGATSLLKIDNEKAITNKTLYIFRDSFGSSLTPLFVHYYKTIYVVDLRYINSTMLKKYVTINKEDEVLFMYSTGMMQIPGNFKID